MQAAASSATVGAGGSNGTKMRFPPIRIACAVLTVFLTVSCISAQEATPPNPEPKPAVPKKPSASPHRLSKAKKRTGPRKVVVHQGGATAAPAQMAPVAPEEKAHAERASSDRLLTATEANLKKLSGRKLTDDEQSLVNQIQQFVKQSRAALDAGDLTQGYNLASKANVLSEEFNKP